MNFYSKNTNSKLTKSNTRSQPYMYEFFGAVEDESDDEIASISTEVIDLENPEVINLEDTEVIELGEEKGGVDDIEKNIMEEEEDPVDDDVKLSKHTKKALSNFLNGFKSKK